MPIIPAVTLTEQRRLNFRCPECSAVTRVSYGYTKKEVTCRDCRRQFPVKGILSWDKQIGRGE